jgi:transketolase
MPEMVGGSADLTGSNNTRTAANKAPMTPENYGGRYVHWGIREHAMAAAMNGMALHGGIIPYSGTFLVFSDYSRPAIRLGALMGQRVIHVMTHDSIGVGEDGPTHQPVEHVASLRNDSEPAGVPPGGWRGNGGGLGMALARDGRAVADRAHPAEPGAGAQDAHRREPRGQGRLCPLARHGRRRSCCWRRVRKSRSRWRRRRLLEAEGIGARVVSMPCFELFAPAAGKYRAGHAGQGNCPRWRWKRACATAGTAGSGRKADLSA